jgi:ABC-2 type transport system permease protein
MRALLAITGRDYASMFRVPVGWVVLALGAWITGSGFVAFTLVPGRVATLREFFIWCWISLLLLAPAISMRSFSEEKRSGTLETAMTAPVPDGVLVLGKYLACVLFLVTMLLPSLVCVGVLEGVSRPDYGPILSGYLGVVLVGMLYLAIGTLSSVCTSSQMLAFLAAVVGLILLDLVPWVLAPRLGEPWAGLLLKVCPVFKLSDFREGLIDTGHVVFFLAASTWFLVLATVVLQSRRWR